MSLSRFLTIIFAFFMVVGCNTAYGEIQFPIDSKDEAIIYAKNITKNDKDVAQFIKSWRKLGYKVKYSAYFDKESDKWDVFLIPDWVLDACYQITFTSSGKIIEKSECRGG